MKARSYLLQSVRSISGGLTSIKSDKFLGHLRMYFFLIILFFSISYTSLAQGCTDNGGLISLSSSSLVLDQTTSACGTLSVPVYDNQLPAGGPYEYVYWFVSASGAVSPTVEIPGTGPTHTFSFTEAQMSGNTQIGMRRCLRLVGTILYFSRIETANYLSSETLSNFTFCDKWFFDRST